jgi:uncharacterized membrane protein
MDVNYIVLLVVAVLIALVYGIIGFFAANAKTAEGWDWAKFAATIIYSIAVGLLAALSGTFTLEAVSLDAIAPYFAMYLGFLYILQQIMDALFMKLGWKKGLARAFTPKPKV